MNNDITIKEYLRQVDQWIQSVGGYFGPLTNGSILAEEVGEINRLLCREFGEQRYKKGEKPDDFNHALGDELADLIFVAVCIANERGIDLTSSLSTNLLKKAQRDANRFKPEGE